MQQPLSSCLVVGGGLSGLMAATTLQQKGIQVTVVDKGYGIGGRLASRSVAIPSSKNALLATPLSPSAILSQTAAVAKPAKSSAEKGLFDYGAQFFTGSDPRFQSWIDHQVKQGLMQKWSDDGFVSHHLASSVRTKSIPAPCFRGTQSNRSVAQQLAKTLDVRNQTRIATLTWGKRSQAVETAETEIEISGTEGISGTEEIAGTNRTVGEKGWTAIATNGQSFFCDAVIMTSPVPQTLQILDDSGIHIESEHRQKLEQVSYSRTIAILAVLDQASAIAAPGGQYINSKDVMWLASNFQKGISPLPSVTLHATPEFSDRHWDGDKDDIAQQLLKSAVPWLGDASVLAYHFHRWGYSQPTTLYGESFATITVDGASAPLLLAGDAFGPPAITSHVERAWLSGIAAAHHLCA